MNPFLQTSIEFLKQVGPQRASLLQKELEVFTFQDLLQHFPFRHIDRSRFYQVKDLHPDLSYVQLKGQITRVQHTGVGRAQRLVAQFTDGTGELELVWFQGAQWVMKSLKPGLRYVIFGKPGLFGKNLNMAHPELEPEEKFNQERSPGLQPVYNTSELMKKRGVDTKTISRLMLNLIHHPEFSIPEIFPAQMLQENQLISREMAFKQLHFPANQEQWLQAKKRLQFEELFFLQYGLIRSKVLRNRNTKGFIFAELGEPFHTFYDKHLPFELTNAQKRVIREIRNDLKTGKQMNRLLQGDVGSGKTIVALLVMLIAIGNQKQTALMAPTEILATQHFLGISQLLEPMGISVKLLTGTSSQAERKQLLKELAEGTLSILIGTHALIEEPVQFKELGLVIIDEQHRFGVQQRAKLWTRYAIPPHVLVMTATPIPRTLAMSLYGDLDVSRIDELPAGRKAIRTMHANEAQRVGVYNLLKQEITKGRQVYVVYPLIEESEKLDLQNLMAGYEQFRLYFPEDEYLVDMLHGKMKPDNKERVMQDFKAGKTHVLLSTTVIEVGVNVPNASVMVIENAERFGLSQLHQLRGRVGRGAEQSYCVLMTSNKISQDGRERMKIMVNSNDGFVIAEKDLQMRGPGDIEGTRQSGLLELKLTSLATDQQAFEQARQAVEKLVEKDPNLEQPEHAALARFYQQKKGGNYWGRVS